MCNKMSYMQNSNRDKNAILRFEFLVLANGGANTDFAASRRPVVPVLGDLQ